MKYNQIPNTDLMISEIALGTWVFSGDMWGESSEVDCLKAVQKAKDSGINFIDTAPIYGNGRAERIVGKAVKGKRDHFTIATKCGLISEGRRIEICLKPASIYQEIEASLRRLNIDCIDLYQCHWPDHHTPIEDTLDALIKLQQQGKIRYLGVSNFNKEQLKEAMEFTGIATLQNQYSLLERSMEDDILPFVRKKGVGLISYGALAGGILSGKYCAEKKFPKADARHFFYKYYSGKTFERVQILLSQMKECNRPLNQLAINWVRQQEGISSVIIGCRTPEQVLSNVQAVQWNLAIKELSTLAQMGGGNNARIEC